jgi:sugar phosphate isomerase/epimerase
MRLGANIYNYTSASEWINIHIAKGYGAAYWPLGVDAPVGDARDYLNAARDHGVIIAEVGIWNNMNDPDPAKRAANFDYAVRRLETAEFVGARCAVNISGSRNSIWDAPHPLNLTKDTFDMVVTGTQRLIDAVNPTHTTYTLEPMPWMYPHDISDALALLAAIDREAYAFHIDMANLVNSYDKYISTGEFTREFFAPIKDKIRSVHVKDSKIDETRMTLHIDEAIPGDGDFDIATLLILCDTLDPDTPIMLEHLSSEAEYDKATAHMRKLAGELGLKYLQGTR